MAATNIGKPLKAKPSQNFQPFFLYVYNQEKQDKNTAIKTEVILLLPRLIFRSGIEESSTTSFVIKDEIVICPPFHLGANERSSLS